jgi:cytochrome oxidase assembly protein ShyY1
MDRYRFALRPKWIVSHLFVLLLVASMLGAMVWQIQRLHFKERRNERIRTRTAEPAVPVQQLTSPDRSYASTAQLEFHRVTATGRYLDDQTVLIRSRSNDSSPGSWAVTPLDLGNGVAVAVNRGWFPNSGQLDRVPKSMAAPKGIVTVRGLVRQSEVRHNIGPKDPKTGTLRNLARADVARIDQQVPERLLPMYLQLRSQTPKVVFRKDPEPVPFPELDNGPHLSYAVQWAIFSSIALIGYPLILRRRAREIERGEEDDDFDPDGRRLRGDLDPDEPDRSDVPSSNDPRLDAPTG